MVSRLLVSAVLLLFPVRVTATADDRVDYEKQIQPIFLQHCAQCHGEKTAAAKMRLHTAAALKEKWDTETDLIVPGQPEKSALYQRLVLPADDTKRMPKKADPLPQETIALVAAWIKQGAALSGAAAVAEPISAKPAEGSAPVEKAEEAPLPEVAAAPEKALGALSAAGAQVVPLCAGSNLLQVSFAHRGEPAGDPEIALLSGVADQVYSLNLENAKPTDAGVAPLAALKNLSVLHLEHSAVTDDGLAHLAGLANLQYLNLYDTNISDAGLAHLAGLKQLRRLYLWQTKASYDAAAGLVEDIPGLIFNLGYDHPVVVRMRLTKELDSVQKQAEEAKTALAQAQQQLEGAKKNADAVNARLTAVQKQLKDLETP